MFFFSISLQLLKSYLLNSPVITSSKGFKYWSLTLFNFLWSLKSLLVMLLGRTCFKYESDQYLKE